MRQRSFHFLLKAAPARLVVAAIFALFFAGPANQPVHGEAAQMVCPWVGCAGQQIVYLPMVVSQKASPESLFALQVYGAQDSPAAALGLARAANVSWIRTQMAWDVVEPVKVDPAAYKFAAYDKSLFSAIQQGVRPVVTLINNPKWAATYANGPINPADVDEFGKFVGAAVERYDGDGIDDAPGSPRVRYWEFYNEPDSGDLLRAEYGQAYWGNYGKQYGEMLCTAYRYAKAADPDAQIVFGGVAHDWFKDEGGPFVESFVEDALAAGAGKCFDVMNFHYYPIFAARWQPYGSGIAGKAEYFRRLMAKYGVADKPLMCTEAGWHSDADASPPSSPQEQAEFVVKLFSQAKSARLLVNVWWSWMDFPSIVGSYGLLTDAGTPKPSYYAYRYAASRIGSAASSEVLSAEQMGSSNLEGYSFAGSSPFYVLWSNDAVVRKVRLSGSNARLLDIFGNESGVVADAEDGAVDARVTVAVGPAPVYVEIWH